MKIELLVNGESYEVDIEPQRTLANALRIDCRASQAPTWAASTECADLLYRAARGGGAVCSCLMFAVQCDGARIRTVEGLASADGEPHPLQRTFADEHGLQCGFCTQDS